MAERKTIDLPNEDFVPETLTISEAKNLYQGTRIAMLVTALDLYRSPSHGIVVAVDAENVNKLLSMYDPPDGTTYYLLNCPLKFPRSQAVMRRALGLRVMAGLMSIDADENSS